MSLTYEWHTSIDRILKYFMLVSASITMNCYLVRAAAKIFADLCPANWAAKRPLNQQINVSSIVLNRTKLQTKKQFCFSIEWISCRQFTFWKLASGTSGDAKEGKKDFNSETNV